MQEEEARRNSVLSDMLFVSMSHTLSPYIFSLDSRCKQLTDKERVEVKEKIDPVARFLSLEFLLVAHEGIVVLPKFHNCSISFSCSDSWTDDMILKLSTDYVYIVFFFFFFLISQTFCLLLIK